MGYLLSFLIVLRLYGGLDGLRASFKYASALRVIEKNYIADYEPDRLTDEALRGAVGSLDAWSYYMNAEEYAAYQDYSANRYQGIGVTISKDEETGGFLVISTQKDGPAQLAGIVPGDIILAVDGQSVTEGDTEYLRSLIQADFGKNAMLTVLCEDGTEREVSVSCEEIYSSPVSYEMLADDVGYIIISNFREGAGEEAGAAVDALIGEGARSLLFDVRSNPGGQVSELVEILDHLLPEGDVFIRADKNGNEHIDRSDAACIDLPIAVLVNADSYSAAEFFAAALREYGRAQIVGEATTGKARSQITVELADGSAVHLSKYTYLTPQRNDLYEAGGLTPDVEIPLTDEERLDFDTGWLEPEDDPQVQAGIDVLRA